MNISTTNLLADLLFAYANKDSNMPHGFEINVSFCLKIM